MRTKEEFEKEVRTIIGKKLLKVYYSMIDYEDDKNIGINIVKIFIVWIMD